MGFCDRISASDVCDADTLTRYVCQTVGSPYAFKDTIVMKKKLNEFFAAYPKTSYDTMIKVAHWARAKKKRPAHAFYIVDMARYAWADGALPELDPSNVDSDLETNIRRALEEETNPEWRRRLIGSEGAGRRVVFDAWRSRVG